MSDAAPKISRNQRKADGFARFNAAWEKGQIELPVVILIGGYAGTGKSTLAAPLTDKLDHTQTIPTGIFRSIAQTQTTPQKNPTLYTPTYDLHLATKGDQQMLKAFYGQCQVVARIVMSVMGFMSVEKQNLILEGNHIVPNEDYSIEGCNVIELYLYVEDEKKHLAMMGGPTHHRDINQAQLKTGRRIQEDICAKARARNKPLFETDDAASALQYVNAQLGLLLDSMGL